MTTTVKKFQIIFDGDSIFLETYNPKEFREELIELLDVNDILLYETLTCLDIDTLMIITQIEMSCQIKIELL